MAASSDLWVLVKQESHISESLSLDSSALEFRCPTVYSSVGPIMSLSLQKPCVLYPTKSFYLVFYPRLDTHPLSAIGATHIINRATQS